VILGILSDTHGYAERTAQAIRLLERLGAEAFIHCGDIGGEGVLDEFAGRKTWLVLGNTDFYDPTLMRYAEKLGLNTPDAVPLEIEIDKHKIAVFHGHEARFNRLARALRTRDYAAVASLTRGLSYIFYGHTHVAADLRVEHVRMINPGALERARPYTAATLDLEHDELEHWQVLENAGPLDPPIPHKPR